MPPKWTTEIGSYMVKDGFVEDRPADDGPAVNALLGSPRETSLLHIPPKSKLHGLPCLNEGRFLQEVACGLHPRLAITPTSVKLSSYKLCVVKNEHHKRADALYDSQHQGASQCGGAIPRRRRCRGRFRNSLGLAVVSWGRRPPLSAHPSSGQGSDHRRRPWRKRSVIGRNKTRRRRCSILVRECR